MEKASAFVLVTEGHSLGNAVAYSTEKIFITSSPEADYALGGDTSRGALVETT
jgi:hypothetical protein